MVRKPWAVWAAQAVCVFIAVSTLYFCQLLDDRMTRDVLAFMGVFYLLLAFAAQRRLGFSRWAIVGMFGMTALGSLHQVLQGLSSHGGDAMMLQVGAGMFVVLTVISVNLALGEPSKKYFVAKLRG